jgi:predicted ATPase
MPSPFIVRVRMQSFKSIKACDVELGPLTILVGPNGSGKSNFLDAFRFTADALSTTLDWALRERGGITEVRRRSGGHPHHFAIHFDLQLRDGTRAAYGYKVGAVKGGGFQVTDETCTVHSVGMGEADVSFRVRGGEVSTTLAERMPAAAQDRLYLVSASNVAPFRAVFDGLTNMGFYNLSPEAIRPLQQPDAGTLLRRDGGNLASVLGHLATNNPVALDRIVEYLRRVAPGVVSVAKQSIGPMETIEFKQRVAGRSDPWAFSATNMSDGTLRGLGVLVALLQSNGRPPTFIGIEEPEVALHPAAVGVLVDAIRDASRTTQVAITSHSPELLDREDIEPSNLLSVVADQGVSVIGPISQVGRDIVRERMFTPGELLRADQLEPSDEARRISQLDADQLRLFPT